MRHELSDYEWTAIKPMQLAARQTSLESKSLFPRRAMSRSPRFGIDVAPFDPNLVRFEHLADALPLAADIEVTLLDICQFHSTSSRKAICKGC
jgi:hypothetical protein